MEVWHTEKVQSRKLLLVSVILELSTWKIYFLKAKSVTKKKKKKIFLFYKKGQNLKPLNYALLGSL